MSSINGTPVAGSTTPQEYAPAIALLKSLTPNGIPASWLTTSGQIQHHGKYDIITSKSSNTIGVYWNNGDNGVVLPFSGNTINYDKPIGSGPHLNKSKTDTTINWPSWATSAGKLLGELGSSTFWKRVGIGGLGVLLLIIALVLMLRHDVPTPQNIVKAVTK